MSTVANTEQSEVELADALMSSMERCRQLIADFEAKRISEPDLRKLLRTTGLLVRDDATYIFDVARRCWAKYDGITMTFGPDLGATQGEAQS
jgi:hypothetical protein